jgi:uncharacterized Ntn-hydrolase superfamily protein
MPPLRPATFSIVARDPDKDAVGVAVQSKFISVGSVVPFAAADAGAIATQSFANVAYGPDGLSLLREGTSAADAIEELVSGDEEVESRQVGVVGQDGSVAAFTGEECFEYAGDRQGETYTVQGNILENRETLTAMAEEYETTEGGLPERLIAALHAGNEAGGDKRGEQSAALYVVKPDGGYDARNDRWIDVRIDDHDHPIDELERVFKLYDITLLERTKPDEVQELHGETASEVLAALADLGLYEDEPDETFGDDARVALENFRGMNNFENHDLAVLEDALARGWSETEIDAETETGKESGENGASEDTEERLIDAIWNGLSGRERL